MRRAWPVVAALLVGCSTAPVADVLDFIRPGRIAPETTPPFGGVCAPQPLTNPAAVPPAAAPTPCPPAAAPPPSAAPPPGTPLPPAPPFAPTSAPGASLGAPAGPELGTAR